MTISFAEVQAVAADMGLTVDLMGDYDKSGVFTARDGRRFLATWAHSLEELRHQLQYQLRSGAA